MNRRFALWSAAVIFTFTLAFAGCQKKEEPAPTASPAPAAGAPTEAGAVVSAPGTSETRPKTPEATGETKTAEKKEAGPKKY